MAGFDLARGALRLGAALVPSVALFPFALLSRAADRFGGAPGRRLALRLGARVQSLWARGTLAGLGVRVVTDGTPPRGAFVVTANHVSYLDILVLSWLFPSRFVAKSEIAGWPLIGVLGRSVGTIFLRQRDRRDLVRVGDEMERTLESGLSVTVFPEGAASDGSGVRRFHGPLLQPAARRGLPCLPVALRYETPGAAWTPRTTVAWWGDMALAGHLVRLARLPRVEAVVVWGEACAGDDRKALATACEDAVRALFRPLAEGPPPPRGPRPSAAVQEGGTEPADASSEGGKTGAGAAASARSR